jgi:hypothetical protein
MSESAEDRRDREPALAAPPRDDEAHRAAVRTLHAQADSLGVLDALDAEPALTYRPDEAAR